MQALCKLKTLSLFILYVYIQICGCEYLYISPEIVDPPQWVFQNPRPKHKQIAYKTNLAQPKGNPRHCVCGIKNRNYFCYN